MIPPIEQVREHTARYPIAGECPGGLWRCVGIGGGLEYIVLGVLHSHLRWRRHGERIWEAKANAVLLDYLTQFTPCDQDGNPLPLVHERDKARTCVEKLEMQKAVAVAVFIQLDRSGSYYLFMRRHESAAREPGKWMVPGGILEVGETVEQCARRECREEIGCEIVKPCVREILTDVSSKFVLILVTAWLAPGEDPRCMEPDKHEPPIWLDMDRIGELYRANLMPGSQMHFFGPMVDQK